MTRGRRVLESLEDDIRDHIERRHTGGKPVAKSDRQRAVAPRHR